MTAEDNQGEQMGNRETSKVFGPRHISSATIHCTNLAFHSSKLSLGPIDDDGKQPYRWFGVPKLKHPSDCMKTLLYLILGLSLSLSSFAQTATIKGQLQEAEGTAVAFANVVLYRASDSTIVKVETTDEAGLFRFSGIVPDTYDLQATYVGLTDYWQRGLATQANEIKDLGVLSFGAAGIELAEATVTAQRALVEVKPDRTVFNVQGTINSTGEDAISLLRKAPSVTVDNNDNISVLGRTGVLLYVDGKRLPLTGDALTNYLQSLSAEQIDRIDIITNPGARYEAEGNAGIIDIRLKKDENLGANGSVNLTGSQGRLFRGNGSVSGNYRNRWMNVFGQVGGMEREAWSRMEFNSTQFGLRLRESEYGRYSSNAYNYRIGTDFFLNDQHTVGFLVGGNHFDGMYTNTNRISIAQDSPGSTVDSILVANNRTDDGRDQGTYNLNYRFTGSSGQTFNFDADYGRFRNDRERFQPNQYFDAAEDEILTEVINSFTMPTDIDIYTLKADYEQKLWGGQLGFGSKYSQVISDNIFLVFDVEGSSSTRNDRQSNTFRYDEQVYAGYVTYARPINEQWQFSAGLRAEQTNARGNLQAFLPELQEDPVVLDYLNWFPNVGLTWQVSPQNSLAFNYGRRINRPDYNVLNPFNNQLSQLSYEKGNPFLRPEIVNNFEIGYTLQYRYNFKIGYSRTTDQITRLIGPDEEDNRANFITWENLASQTIYSGNISAPIQVTEGWNAYFNLSASYLDNQADYGDGAIVDIQAFTYNFYSQQSFKLPWKLQGEISGWYGGPGIWGGVFAYESQWSLNLGLQRKFLDDQLNVRLSATDLFYESNWDGVSEFNGLRSEGFGRNDTRRASIAISYNFGNQKVKSRKRRTGIEDEAGRVGQ
jgi:iron complex outermembrane receptor protein